LKQKILYAHFAILGANIIYAINYGFAKDVMNGGYVPPFAFILLRAIGATTLFWVTSYFFYEKVSKSDLLKFALCGLFGVTANQLMFFNGLELTSTIHASIIMVTSPIIVSILSIIILKEKLHFIKVVGVIIGLIGAVTIISENNSVSGNSGLKGDILIFLNAISFGLYLIFVKPLMSKYSPITVVKWVFTFGLIGVFPFGLYEIKEINWEMSNEIILKIGFVIFFTTYLCYLFNIYGVKYVSPTIVSTYIYLQPFLTSFIAVFSGRENLNLTVIGCSILIFLGVYLVSININKKIN
jgi:drug/metabolite transporter (DMT)-like permease